MDVGPNFLHRALPLNRILFIRFIFGHHFIISSRKKWLLTISKIYCIFVSFFIPCLLTDISIPRLVIVIEYALAIWMTLLVESHTFSKYSNAIKGTDRAFGVRNLSLVSYRIYLIFFLMTMSRFFLHFLNLYGLKLFRPRRFFVYTFIYTSIDFSHIIRLLALDIFYDRLLFLRKYFENVLVCPTVGEDNASKVKEGLLFYKQLLDGLQFLGKIKATYIISLSVRFFTGGYLLHTGLLLERNLLEMVIYAADAVHAAVLVSAPAMLMELALNEHDKITSIFLFHQAKCTDPNLRAAISKAISYIQLRPLQFQFWRIIPFDSSLLMSFGGLLFTYTFIILQLHHIL